MRSPARFAQSVNFVPNPVPIGWVTLGGLIVGPLVRLLAPEAEGHGVPEVIEAVMLGGRRIRRRVAAVKSLASAVTIGTGDTVGREGPTVQIGAAVGSALGQVLQLPANLRVTYNLTVVAIRDQAGDEDRLPDPDKALRAGDVLVVVGRPADINNFRLRTAGVPSQAASRFNL